jgi:ribosomal protein S17E
MDEFEDFTDNFEENKKIINEKVKTYSKKVRNRITGYLTKIKKKGIVLKKIE